MVKIGDIEVSVISGGRYRLDGGAMFGIVPKPLWEKLNPSDERNRIDLDTNCLLIKAYNNLVLVDTGNGDKFSQKDKDIYHIDKETTILSSLNKLDIKAEDIDYVILSHLHFDHAGGATIKDETEKVIPAFPNARYIIQRQEFEDAVNNFSIMKATYLEDNYMPIVREGLAMFIKGNYEVCKGVYVYLTGAHTRGHQIVFIESKGEKGVYLGDIIPTTSHLRLAYGMGYDLFPIDIKDKKLYLLEKAYDEGWIVFFDHEPLSISYGKIIKENDSFQAVRLNG